MAGALDGLGDGGGWDGEVTHLAGAAGFGLAVEVEADLGVGEGRGPGGGATGIEPDIAEKVGHGGG